jgi:flagellar basal-body rod protein FlgG
MRDAISVVTSAMQADVAGANRISANVANVSTAGYKRQVVSAGAFLDSLNAAAGVAPASASSGSVDQRPGALLATGHALDLAISGVGYFEVATPHGPAYTRAGSFHVDSRGRLVDAAGDAVQGADGEIALSSNVVKVDAAGHVTDNGRAAGQLKIVAPNGAVSIEPLGNGLYSISSVVPAPSLSRVVQGYIENSNVDPMLEMTDLMTTMRHFESLQKAALADDEMLQTAIQKIGEV